MREGVVLTLDMARTCGWCVGAPGARPVYGSQTLGGVTPFDVFNSLVAFLDDRWTMFGPFRVVAESPLLHTAHRSEDTAKMLYGLWAHLGSWCADEGVKCDFVGYQEPRKNLLGRGNFPAGQAKIAVMTWCEAHGFSPADDNAADALLLWHHATGWKRQPSLKAVA